MTKGKRGTIAVRDRGNAELSNILDLDTLDPTMHYHFVQRRQRRISAAIRQGYRAVVKEDGVKPLFEGMHEDDGTGTILDGDTVLMMTTRENYDRRSLEKENRRKGRIASADQRFRNLAQRSGVRVADKAVGNEPTVPGE